MKNYNPIKCLLVFSVSLLLGLTSAKSQFIYQSPLNGSKFHKTKAAILLRTATPVDPSSIEKNDWIRIEGSKSGSHRFAARVAGDQRTIIVNPDPSFAYDEMISVNVSDKLQLQNGSTIQGQFFTFQTEKEPTQEELINRAAAKKIYDEDILPPQDNLKMYNIDSLPTFKITVNNNPAKGSFFWNNQNDLHPEYTNSYNVIMTNGGKITYAKDMGINGHDFKINYNGYLTYHDYDHTQWIEMDSNYNKIDSFKCVNGYETETDGHDFIIYPDGRYFLIAFDQQTVNMTQYGGLPDATVIGLIIQEFDKDKDLLFQWRSWDHLNITDADDHISLTISLVDYVHGNALELDNDGNLLYSARSMCEIVKLNLETGEMMWRLGGENNQFTFVGDPQNPHLSFQHDVRRIANGNITFFDNGNYLPLQISSVKEFSLDEENKVATLVWSYTHPLINGTVPLFGRATGSCQRLNNGNTLIGWGTVLQNPTLPNATEVDPDGNIVWEMAFDSLGWKSYRFHKYEWNPCSRPTGYTMTSIVKPGKVTVTWGIATGAKQYALQYKKASATQWTQIVVQKPHYTLTALSPSTVYNWRVKSSCSDTKASEFSEVKIFTTAPQKSFELTATTFDVSLYPNPAQDYLNVYFANDLKLSSTISVFNSCGSEISSISVGEGIQDYRMDISQLPAGMYCVKLQTGSETLVKRFVKE